MATYERIPIYLNQEDIQGIAGILDGYRAAVSLQLHDLFVGLRDGRIRDESQYPELLGVGKLTFHRRPVGMEGVGFTDAEGSYQAATTECWNDINLKLTERDALLRDTGKLKMQVAALKKQETQS